MTETFSPTRANFAERVAMLAGGTTYREPMGSHGTRSDYMPTAHAIAAAMACARVGPHDIGPDIAVAIATGCPDHRMKIVRELAACLLASMGKMGDRNADDLLPLAAHCYLSVMGLPMPGVRGIPGIRPRDYLLLRRVGESALWSAAETAYQRANRAYRRVA